jgi:hypothetical protein
MIRITYIGLVSVLLAVSLLVPAHLFAQTEPVSVKAEIDRQQAYIGDRLNFTLTIVSDSSIAVDSIPIGDRLGDFEVKGREYDMSGTEDGRIRLMAKFIIAAYETGPIWLPRVKLSFLMPDSTMTEIETDSLRVTILSLAEGDSLADIRRLKPEVYFGGRFPWIYLIIGAIVVSALVYWLVKRKKRMRDGVDAEPVDTRPPWVVAEERLKYLRESSLLADSEFKPFYLRLTDIIRRYLEPRYGIDVLDRTTFELRGEMSRMNLDQRQYDRLFDMFDGADLVKFAKFHPELNQAETDFQRAWQFVRETGQERRAEVADA